METVIVNLPPLLGNLLTTATDYNGKLFGGLLYMIARGQNNYDDINRISLIFTSQLDVDMFVKVWNNSNQNKFVDISPCVFHLSSTPYIVYLYFDDVNRLKKSTDKVCAKVEVYGKSYIVRFYDYINGNINLLKRIRLPPNSVPSLNVVSEEQRFIDVVRESARVVGGTVDMSKDRIVVNLIDIDRGYDNFIRHLETYEYVYKYPKQCSKLILPGIEHIIEFIYCSEILTATIPPHPLVAGHSAHPHSIISGSGV